MLIFSFSNCRSFLKHYLELLPRRGHGEMSKIASHLNVHSTLVSMIFSGERDLTYEQGFDLCGYLQLTNDETEFFLLLVQLQRAGNTRLKSHFESKIKEMREKQSKVASVFDRERKLKENEKAIFYSSWLYSAIRLYCDTHKKGRTLEDVVSHFRISRKRALEHLQFLKSAGLLVDEKGHYRLGSNRTYLDIDSPFLPRHHMNWRTKSLNVIDRVSNEELIFTCPHSVSREDFAKIRREISETLKNVLSVIKTSEAQEVACLNIDLFWVRD